LEGRDSTPRESHRDAPNDAPHDAVVITLSTSGHEWRFACAHGEEHVLVDALIDLVERDDAPLEWSDAAAVIRRLNDQPATHPTSQPTSKSTSKSNPIEPHA